MATATPKEYLTLANTGGPVPSFGNTPPAADAFNYSMLEENGCLFHTITFWSKVRLDPVTLQVDINDTTFATNAINSLPCSAFKQSYAIAEGCSGDSVTAYANLNLEGTPFAVDAAQQWNFYNVGYVNRSSNDQVVDLGVGGSCGQINPTDNATLQLVYIWPTASPFRGLASSPALVGPKGDKGDQGDPGATGPQGPQGLQGPQGTSDLPAGTIIMLNHGTVPPAGWTFLWQLTLTSDPPKPTKLVLDVYVKH